ncbi:metal-dependent hydrolase [Candidatus Woesebacteria bacterium]|nr:metal-dependent hydrolase [Candidatus Woesebacteria bacterium]
MTTLTHFSAGLVVGAIAQRYLPNSYLHGQTVYAISILASQLPDVNVFWKPLKTHHDDLTHYPIFWVGMSALTAIVEYVLHKTPTIGFIIFISTILHMFLDTFGWSIGLRWLAPFSMHEFSFTPLEKDKVDFDNRAKLQSLFRHISFKYEILVNLLFWCLFLALK